MTPRKFEGVVSRSSFGDSGHGDTVFSKTQAIFDCGGGGRTQGPSGDLDSPPRVLPFGQEGVVRGTFL